MESTTSATPETATAELPDAGDAFAWAFQAMKNRNWRNAAERWAVLRQAYPGHAPAWIQAAIAHRHLDELDKAQALLEHACKAFPNNPNAWLQKAEVAIAGEQWQQALDNLNYLQREFPADIAGWVRIADVHALMGDKEKAYSENARAREAFEDRPWPWVQYAEFAMQEENHELALERWAEVRQRFPDHAAGYQRAADAAEAIDNPRQARQLRAAQEYGNAWLESISDEGGMKTETEHTITPPVRRNWQAFIDLVWTKARLNLKSEANKNYLRYLWWVIDPVLYMLVFYTVFGILLNRGGDGFVGYLLTGIVPFQWFAKTTTYCAGSIFGGRGLMNQVSISPIFFPLVGIVQNSGKQFFVFLMLGVFLCAYGLTPAITWLALVPVMLVQLLFMVAVSCVISLIVPFARDLLNLIPTGIQFLMFSSGVFYSTDIIPPDWRSLFFTNPVANLLYQYRQVLVEQQWPDWSSLMWVTAGSIVGLLIVAALYRKVAPILPRVVIQ